MNKVKLKRSPVIVRRGVLLDLERKGIAAKHSQKALESFLCNFKQRGVGYSKLTNKRILRGSGEPLEQRYRRYATLDPQDRIGWIRAVYPVRNAEGLIIRIEADVALDRFKLKRLGFEETTKAYCRTRLTTVLTPRGELMLTALYGLDFALKGNKNGLAGQKN